MPAPTQAPLCKRCRQRLAGAFVKALGSAWHPDCWRCEACGKPLRGPFVEAGGAGYHAECHRERFGLRCSVCGKVLQGPYYTHEGKPVCEPDYRARFAPRCFYCDEALQGTFSENAHGQRACARHDHGPRCTSCDRWLGRKESLLAPLGAFGTTLCGHCQPEAVGHGALGNYGNAFGAGALREVGLALRAIPPVPIRLEPALLVSHLKGSLETQVDGLTQTSVASLGGRETARTIQGIVIVGGLAREHFEGVLAHEFGHVWLFAEGRDGLPPLRAEGFCELVRYRWLERLGTPLAAHLRHRMAESQDPVYGSGFRLLKGAWDRGGTEAALALLRS